LGKGRAAPLYSCRRENDQQERLAESAGDARNRGRDERARKQPRRYCRRDRGKGEKIRQERAQHGQRSALIEPRGQERVERQPDAA